ncbi:MAG: hypothetical protein AAFW97_08335 [Pseudomonadota bacterium]
MDNYIFGLFATNELLVTPASQLEGMLPAHVQLWLVWLLAIGATSLIWSFWKVEARYVALAFILTFAASFVVGQIWGPDAVLYVSLSLFHVMFWTPVLALLIQRRANANFSSLYGIWLWLAMATMAISLVFDYRDVIAYLLM